MLLDQRPGGFTQALHADAVVAEDVRLGAGDGFFVGNADDAERLGHAGLHQHGGAGFAQAAVDHVFFHRDDGAAFASGFENGFRVQRLDRVHGKHPGVDAAFRQLRGGEQGVDHRFAGGDEGDDRCLRAA